MLLRERRRGNAATRPSDELQSQGETSVSSGEAADAEAGAPEDKARAALRRLEECHRSGLRPTIIRCLPPPPLAACRHEEILDPVRCAPFGHDARLGREPSSGLTI